MRVVYKTGELTGDRVAQAFPVVREIAADLTLEAWSAFARATVEGGADSEWPSGVIVADLDGYIRGLFTYRVTPDLRHGRTLVVSNFAVLHMVARKTLADALLDAVGELARRHRCAAVHAAVPAQSRWAVAYFEDHGHHVEQHVLCQIPPAWH